MPSPKNCLRASAYARKYVNSCFVLFAAGRRLGVPGAVLPSLHGLHAVPGRGSAHVPLRRGAVCSVGERATRPFCLCSLGTLAWGEGRGGEVGGGEARHFQGLKRLFVSKRCRALFSRLLCLFLSLSLSLLCVKSVYGFLCFDSGPESLSGHASSQEHCRYENTR